MKPNRMGRRCLAAALSLFAITALSQPKGTLVIIGGGSRPTAMIERIISVSGLNAGGYGVILPMSSAEPDSSVYYAKQPFIKAGVDRLFGVHFKKGATFPKSRIDSIRGARLIYITGGDQNRFMAVAAGTEIETAIRDAYLSGVVVAGTSAGAAVMSEVMITGNSLRYPDYTATFETIESNNLETTRGLGLIKTAVIDQHFLIRSRYNRLITAVIEFPGLKGIGIDESTALLVHGDEGEVVGNSQIIVFENLRGSKSEKNGKLAARGVTMSIYLPGEKIYLGKK